MDEVGLGKQLQSIRTKAGLTQQALCQLANISYSTLAKIERGAIKSPSIFTIQNIAEALGVSMDQLLGLQTINSSLPPIVPKKISKTGIRFVYFDVNGCLVRFFHRAFKRLAEETGASTADIEAIFWHYNDSICRGEMTMDEFNSELSKVVGEKSVDWAKYYFDAVESISQMQDLLNWTASNYHYGLLTNIMPGFLNELIERQLIPNMHYEVIIDSSQIGSIKPENPIFEEALARSNCQPGEILLIDDSRTNIMAAEKQGWKVLWFDDSNPEESIDRIKKALEFENA